MVPPTLGHAPPEASRTRPLTASVVDDPTIYPYRTQGKLFGTDRGGKYYCSATVVNTPTKRVIFTAGHCVYEKRTGWARRLVFVPGYHNGIRPYGTFVASHLYSTNGWVRNENFSYDVSAAVLGGSRKVAAVVGSRGIAFNQPRQEDFVSFGYPAGARLIGQNGQKLFSCQSPYEGQDASTRNPRTQWIDCNMTGGSSGGGWMIQGRYLNSVNSYGYDGEPNRMYGPYFGTVVQHLYGHLRNRAP